MTFKNVKIALFAVAVVALSACGGGGDDPGDALPTQQPVGEVDDSGGGEAPSEGEAEAFEVSYQIGHTFWHRGFKVDVATATYAGTEPDLFGGQDFTVTIDGVFTNEGEDAGSLGSDLALVTPGAVTNLPFSSAPTVPGGLEVAGELTFRVGDTFAIDDAYLLIGSGGEQQARVPLGPGGGELIALEPADVTISGESSLSLIDFRFTGGTLRADDPVNHRQAAAGKLALTINFDNTSRKPGSWSIFAEEFVLSTPGGANIAADGSLLQNLQGSDAGVDVQDQYVRFLVDDPASGTYTLTWAPPDRWLDEGDPSQLTFEFEVP